MLMIVLVQDLRSKCLITRRREGVHLGSSILWLLEWNKIQVRMQVRPWLTFNVSINGHGKIFQPLEKSGGKKYWYRLIRNTSVICHRKPRLPQTQVTPTSMRELRRCPDLGFVDYLAFFFSGPTTLCFGSPREMNFCETTRHHWKNPRLYVLTHVQQLNS